MAIAACSCPVNVEFDLTGLISPWLHHYNVPPAVTTGIEMLVIQHWVGYYLNQNQFTRDVIHKAQQIVLDGHDIGVFIPDITIPPNNIWYAVMWPTSSRKIIYSASTVQMNGKAVGCAALINFPILPMMSCGDPCSMPLTAPYLSFMNTVRVGLTVSDLGKGLSSMLASIAIDLVFAAMPVPSWRDVAKRGEWKKLLSRNEWKKAFKWAEREGKGGFKNALKQMRKVWKEKKDVFKEEALKKAFDPFGEPKAVAKSLVSAGSNYLISDQADIGIGNPYFGGKVSYGKQQGLGGEVHGLGGEWGSEGKKLWGRSLDK